MFSFCLLSPPWCICCLCRSAVACCLPSNYNQNNWWIFIWNMFSIMEMNFDTFIRSQLYPLMIQLCLATRNINLLEGISICIHQNNWICICCVLCQSSSRLGNGTNNEDELSELLLFKFTESPLLIFNIIQSKNGFRCRFMYFVTARSCQRLV